MACAAALATIEVIEEENLCERSAHLGQILLKRMKQMKSQHPIIGEVRGLGCLLGIELVKDKTSKEPFERSRASWSTRRPSARAWPGFPPAISCACRRRSSWTMTWL